MRGANLYNNPDSVRKPSVFPPFLDIPEEEKRLAAYIAQAKLYLVVNMDTIKQRYASYILDQLCLQNSKLNKYYNEKPEVVNLVRIHANKFILKYILFCEETLVLYNPDGEPCVVVDAYVFTDFDIEAYEEQMLIEYIQSNSAKETYSDSFFTKKAMTKAAGFGGGYGMSRIGTHLTKSGDRLSLLSKHYASGYRLTRRIEKSFRGKKAQRDAFFALINKSTKYGKSATQKTVTGGLLQKLASKLIKGSFRPITILDALNPFDANAPLTDVNHRKKADFYILTELKIYCERNNNYQHIINQQYFSSVGE